MDLGGLGNVNRIDLGKKLAGKVATVRATISETTEGLQGRTSPKDVETMFQLTYLQFTAPRLDTVVYTTFKGQAATFLANRALSPETAFQDTIQVTLAQHAFRARPLSPALFDELNPQKALAIATLTLVISRSFSWATSTRLPLNRSSRRTSHHCRLSVARRNRATRESNRRRGLSSGSSAVERSQRLLLVLCSPANANTHLKIGSFFAH
jgi:hypothetical protein